MNRLWMYLTHLGIPAAPLILMIWYPEVYTVGLEFVLRNLEFMVVMPILMAVFGLYFVHTSARAPYRAWLKAGGLTLFLGFLANFASKMTLAALGYAIVIPALFMLLGAVLFPASAKTHDGT